MAHAMIPHAKVESTCSAMSDILHTGLSPRVWPGKNGVLLIICN